MYPHVQKEAQNEIDAVIGSKRIPTWSDRPNLPYIHAVVEGTLRCRLTQGLNGLPTPLTICSITGLPVALIGPPMPHALSRDETYMGYTLSKGAAIYQLRMMALPPFCFRYKIQEMKLTR